MGPLFFYFCVVVFFHTRNRALNIIECSVLKILITYTFKRTDTASYQPRGARVGGG